MSFSTGSRATVACLVMGTGPTYQKEGLEGAILMPPLFQTFPVEREDVRHAVEVHWGLVLGDCIKASQNHTFHATDGAGTRFIVRVTPDPEGERIQQIQDELAFIRYMEIGRAHV